MSSSLLALFNKSAPVIFGVARYSMVRSFATRLSSRIPSSLNIAHPRLIRGFLVKNYHHTTQQVISNSWLSSARPLSAVPSSDSWARSFPLSLFANNADNPKKSDGESDKSDKEGVQSNSQTAKQKQSGDGDQKQNKGPNDSGEPEGPPNDMKSNLVLIVAFILLSLFNNATGSDKKKSATQEISFEAFEQDVLFQHQVSRIEVDQGFASVFLKETPRKASYIIKIVSYDNFTQKMEEAQKRLGVRPEFFVPVVLLHSRGDEESSKIDPWVILLLLAGLYIFLNSRNNMSRGSGMGPGANRGQDQLLDRLFGKQKAIFRKETNVNVSFKDVEGIDEAKMEVMELVHFLKNPEKYKALGAKVPKGALLTGEPGTGKTLLAKAIAGEAGIPILATSGSEFVEMYVGVGAARVRDLFAEAKKSTPCIIFIDEIDAIGKSRSSSPMRSNDERESCLNQLLVEMDGFSASSNIIVLASTNFADVLDPALLRPGRFDRQINVPKPDLKGRLAIFKLHMKDLKVGNTIEELAKKLAPRTPGLTGADIANICNESALIAVRKNKESITLEDFHDAIDRVTLGFERKGMVITPTEKKIIAYHEAGHAIMSWFLKHTNNLSKVSIIPRGKGALGFAAVEQTDKFLMSDEEMDERMCVFLGGRVSEEIFFGSVTTGAQNDLSQVTRLAYAKIRAFGMNSRIGLLSFPSESETYQKPYSELTGQMIDEEVRNLVNKSYETTKSTLLEKKDLVIELAETLLREETLLESDIEKILGPRPYAHIKMDYDQQVRESELLKQSKGEINHHQAPPTPVPVAISSDASHNVTS